jgi:hypothetical protein
MQIARDGLADGWIPGIDAARSRTGAHTSTLESVRATGAEMEGPGALGRSAGRRSRLSIRMTTSADLLRCVCARRTQRWCGLDEHSSRADRVDSFALSRGRGAPVCGTGRSRGWKWGGWNWMARVRVSIPPHVRAWASAAESTTAVARTRRVSGGRTVYSNSHAASAPAACAELARACRPSQVCASAAWDNTRAMAIPVRGGGRARAKTSAALLRCRYTSRRAGPRRPSCFSPIVKVGEEECAVEAWGERAA